MISQPLQVPPPDPEPLPPPPPAYSLPPPAWQNPAIIAPPPDYAAVMNVVYAGFWIRFVAILIDSVILFVANLIIGFVLGFFIGILIYASGASVNESSTNTLNVLSYFVALVLSAGYFSFYWAGGQTWGMRWLRLRVVDAQTGQPIGVSRGFMRYLGYLVSALPCYVGLIWAAFDPRKQGWHDKIANSVVVQV
jgi:uncharacterized RDD family membrane protein YckC